MGVSFYRFLGTRVQALVLEDEIASGTGSLRNNQFFKLIFKVVAYFRILIILDVAYFRGLLIFGGIRNSSSRLINSLKNS
ncbi:unnamed protein product [Rhizophagus irregularis]|nr:unnamed protein product [Rhizophagus irregularis]